MWQLICLQLETWLSHLFLLGKCCPELAQKLSCVAPELHSFWSQPTLRGNSEPWPEKHDGMHVPNLLTIHLQPGNANHNCWNVFGACSRVRVYSRHCQGEMGAFQKRQIRNPILRSSFTHLSPFSRKFPRNVHFSCNCSEWFGWLVLGAFLWGNYFLYILKCA